MTGDSRYIDAIAAAALLLLAAGAWLYSRELVVLGVLLLCIAGALAVLDDDFPKFKF